jgi:hypothetical protein
MKSSSDVSISIEFQEIPQQMLEIFVTISSLYFLPNIEQALHLTHSGFNWN